MTDLSDGHHHVDDDASELYRYWSASLPHRVGRTHVADEHKGILDAALARDAELAVDLVTRHLQATADELEAIAADMEANEAPMADAVAD